MTSRDIERSASTLGRLAAVLLLSGCAALRLDVVPLPPGACPADPALEQTLAVFVNPAPNRNVRRSANVSQLTIDGLARVHTDRAPFSAPAPTLDEVARLPADVQAAERVYANPAGNSPEGRTRGGDRARFSAESAREAIKLWWAVNEIGRQARLSTATTQSVMRSQASSASPPAPITAALADPKGDLSRRLMSAVLRGGDDVLLVTMAARANVSLNLANTAVADHMRLRRADTELAVAASLMDSDVKLQDLNTAMFLRTYVKAYLRNGRIFQAEFEVGQFVSEAMKTIESQTTLGDQKGAVEKALEQTLGRLCKSTPNGKVDKCLLNGGLGDTTFVTRSGESISFKGIALTVGYDNQFQATWDYPKSSEFAPQLVRVIMEAILDAPENGRVPAVASATACMSSPALFPPNYCIAVKTPKGFVAVTDASAPAPTPTLQDVIVSIDSIASRADSLATILAGEVVRGGSFVSLNNEAVARSIENFFGVTARKVAERAAWQRAVEEGCVTTTPNLLIDVVKN